MCTEPPSRHPAVSFPWFDFALDSSVCKDVQPMALAVRAVLVIEYQVATAEEHGEDGGMTLLGLTSTLQVLAQQEDYHAVGDFLGALENTIPSYDRRDWPGLVEFPLSRDKAEEGS